jgi:hypothetical protein
LPAAGGVWIVISAIISNLDYFHYLLTPAHRRLRAHDEVRSQPADPQHAHHPDTELTNNELTDNGLNRRTISPTGRDSRSMSPLEHRREHPC